MLSLRREGPDVCFIQRSAPLFEGIRWDETTAYVIVAVRYYPFEVLPTEVRQVRTPRPVSQDRAYNLPKGCIAIGRGLLGYP